MACGRTVPCAAALLLLALSTPGLARSGTASESETDPDRRTEYGGAYPEENPTGKSVETVETSMVIARYRLFETALQEKRYPDAIGIADAAFAEGDNEFLYAYRLAAVGLADETSKATKSQFVGKVAPWAERAIRIVESRKKPAGADGWRWEESQDITLAVLIKARAIDVYLRVAAATPTAEALRPAVDALRDAIAKNETDVALWYYLSQAYTSLYGLASTRYSALPNDEERVRGHALLAETFAAADRVVDSYVKLITFAGATSPVAADVAPRLQELWRWRYPESADALTLQIARVANRKGMVGGGHGRVGMSDEVLVPLRFERIELPAFQAVEAPRATPASRWAACVRVAAACSGVEMSDRVAAILVPAAGSDAIARGLAGRRFEVARTSYVVECDALSDQPSGSAIVGALRRGRPIVLGTEDGSVVLLYGVVFRPRPTGEPEIYSVTYYDPSDGKSYTPLWDEQCPGVSRAWLVWADGTGSDSDRPKPAR